MNLNRALDTDGLETLADVASLARASARYADSGYGGSSTSSQAFESLYEGEPKRPQHESLHMERPTKRQKPACTATEQTEDVEAEVLDTNDGPAMEDDQSFFLDADFDAEALIAQWCEQESLPANECS